VNARRISLFVGALCAPVLLHAADSDAADGPKTIPIYINPATYGPSKYTIYASLGDGPLRPYLFDTGSPNLFTFADAQGGTATASFAFGSGTPVYSYFPKGRIVGLGAAGGSKPMVSTKKAVNVAEVVAIDGNTNFAVPLGDGTYGDFGAGFYGTSQLATVLAQIPLPKDLKLGYIVDVAGLNSGAGQLTLGLGRQTIKNLRDSPGALTMRMTPSGDRIPTAGPLIPGYNKAQVGGTLVQFGQGSQTATLTLGTVFDTGGGPNAIVYITGFGKQVPINLSISYHGSTFIQDNGTTPWSGTPQVIDTSVGGPRVNPGGSIYQKNIIMFDLADGLLTLVPASGTSPAVFGKPRTVIVTRLGPGFYQLDGRVRDSNGVRVVSISTGQGESERLYRARLRGGSWTAPGIRTPDSATMLKFDVTVLDRDGETATRTYRVRLPR